MIHDNLEKSQNSKTKTNKTFSNSKKCLLFKFKVKIWTLKENIYCTEGLEILMLRHFLKIEMDRERERQTERKREKKEALVT